MTEENKIIPAEGVSIKLKTFVLILTGITIIAFIALFTKIASKQFTPEQTNSEVQIEPTQSNIAEEYHSVGNRLMDLGLKERAIDQFIKVWQLQKFSTLEKAKAAQVVGQLYASLSNCQEALVWLFRAEFSDTTESLNLQPQIDSCLAKVREKISK